MVVILVDAGYRVSETWRQFLALPESASQTNYQKYIEMIKKIFQHLQNI